MTNLEAKLQTLDRHRQAKEEELRDLERKLVVLLEEQQKELEQIKQRQERRGERFISDDPNAGAIIAAGIGAAPGDGSDNGNGGGGFQGAITPTAATSSCFDAVHRNIDEVWLHVYVFDIF